MFNLSTHLPGKYQWVTEYLGSYAEWPFCICYVNSIKCLILMSPLFSFSYLNSAYQVTVLRYNFNCTMNYFVI